MLTSYIAKQTKSLLYFCLLIIVHLLINGFRIQGRSQEFTEGGQTRGPGDGSPQRGPWAEYGNPKEHQRGRDKY